MTWSHSGFEAAADLLARRTGLVFGPARQAAVEAGVRRAMGRARLSDLQHYVDVLAGDAAVLDDLIVELTVGETYFFREPAQFDFLRREVLPELQRLHGSGAPVRAWSTGCASGEEAYSLAILLTEAGVGARSRLLATDISRAALTKARRAVFGAWSLRGDGAAAAQPYLRPCGDGRFLLDERIKRCVHFEYLNLALDVYPSLTTDAWGMHIVLCRNVLIYFNAETIRAVARRLYETLAPGGWLLTAASDPPLAPHAPFEPVTTDAGVFYRRGQTAWPQVSNLPILSAEEQSASWKLAATLREPPAPTVEHQAPNAEPMSPGTHESYASHESYGSHKTVENLEPLAEAQRAFAKGDYDRAAHLTAGRPDDTAACVLHIRSLANFDADRAERTCADALGRCPLSAELHYLHGVLLLSLGRDDEAARALRRVLYLDRSLAVAHFTLGSVLERCGDAEGARRAYRNARDLCRARPPDEAAPLADGESAGRLAEVAATQLAVLEATAENAP